MEPASVESVELSVVVNEVDWMEDCGVVERHLELELEQELEQRIGVGAG